MLTKAENEMLTKVGAGTPMGELMRRYWIPALLSSELAPNGDPVRIALLGEKLVAWRDSEGKVGVFEEACMHRGASLALARCEGDGLRCLYHGWKYSTDGRILDTPNLQTDTVKEKLRAVVYPAREAGEVLWVYIGPKAKQPPFPRYAFMDLAPEHRTFFRVTVDYNYAQAMEGVLDPTHSPILHQDYITNTWGATDFDVERPAVKIEVENTVFGFHGGASFNAVASDGRLGEYVRVYGFGMPFLSLSPTNYFIFPIPMDDEHTSYMQIQFDPEKILDRAAVLARQINPPEAFENGHFRYGEKDRWGQDRGLMDKHFAGIPGVTAGDWVVQSSMGPVFDRTKESLAPSDQLIIRYRRMLLRAARDLQEGHEPPMLTPEQTAHMQSAAGFLEDASKWRSLVPNHASLGLAEPVLAE